MSSAAAAQPTAGLTARPNPQEVAAMLDMLAAADRQLADALDRIVGSRARVSRGTVTALERILATLRPAVGIRTQLVDVDRRVLASAIGLRRDRHDHLRVLDGGSDDDQH